LSSQYKLPDPYGQARGLRENSLNKLKALQQKNNCKILSKEEEAEQTKEKKERLQEIKKKYSKAPLRGNSHSRGRRIVSAKVNSNAASECGSASNLSACQSSTIISGIHQGGGITKEGLAQLNRQNDAVDNQQSRASLKPPRSIR